MATRLRKTRRLRGSRTHGWGQVGQHRASGHRGGVGISGQLKHHFSSMLKDDPDHFGHDSTHRPHPIVTRKWVNVRDMDDMFARLGGDADGAKTVDLKAAGYDKLLGGGQVGEPYVVIVPYYTKAAAEKIRAAGGEVRGSHG